MNKTYTLTPRSDADSDRVRISLIVTPDLRERIEGLAMLERRSITGQCEILLERALAGHEASLVAA